MRAFYTPLLPLVLVAACVPMARVEEERLDTVVTGEMLYVEPHRDGNSFSCEACHALQEPAKDGLRRAGHAIGDAALRPSFKNGELESLRDAVNTCRVEWMGAPAFAEDDQRWRKLQDFLVASAAVERPNGEAAALVVNRVDPPAQLTGGNPMSGQAVFNQSCIVCHGQDGRGTVRAPELVGTFLTDAQIARRVRTSGDEESSVYPDLTGGRMPFWSSDRLSDDELRDIIAFLLGNDPRDDPAPTMPQNLRACAMTSPKIGLQATLTTRSHGVKGTAEIIDDCTIKITDFHFDGAGIDVRFYGAVGGKYDVGYSMSETDLRRPVPYSGETVYAQLPSSRSLDEFDGLSVWCVPVGISFGDGRF